MDTIERMRSMMGKVSEAKDAVVDKMTEAKDKVAERVMEAKDAVVEKVAEVREKVMGDGEKEGQAPNVLELLKADHEMVNGIFDRMMGPADKRDSGDLREGLFAQLKYELDTHAELEEQIVYPVLERIDALRPKIQEGRKEHDLVKQQLTDLDQASAQSSADSETWMAQLKVLQESVQHHVKEEENDIFPVARKAFNDAELRRLGGKVEAAKKRSASGKPAGEAAKSTDKAVKPADKAARPADKAAKSTDKDKPQGKDPSKDQGRGGAGRPAGADRAHRPHR